MKRKLLSALIALAYTQAQANIYVENEQGALTEEQMERIIVTGSRIPESIDEVPASVTLISREQIQQQLKVSSELQDLLAVFVPGMAASTGSSSNSGQTLRGRSPLVMIDGVPQSTPLRNGALGIRTLDPSAIERIEVIKGATSIYGNGAAGGIINYITKRPNSAEKLSGELSLSTRFSAVKTEDSAGLRANASIDGTAGKFSYVLSATREENGVQRDAEGDVLGLQYGLSDAVTENYFTKMAYRMDDDQSLQLTYNYYESQQDSDLVDVVGSVNSGNKTYAVEDPQNRPKFGEPQGPRGNHNLMLKYTNLDLFNDTQLVVDLYKQRIENVFFFSATLANPDEGYNGGQSIIKSDKQGLRATFNTQFDVAGAEATLIYGVDALNDVTSQPLVDGRIWVPEMDMSNLAGFIQSKWVIADDWIIKAGLRHENIDLEVEDYATLKLCRSTTQCSVPFDVTGGELSYRATTYNLGLRYNAWPQFRPFVSYSEGADISDLGRLLRTATVTDIRDIRTEASIIDNLEAGFTSQLDTMRFDFSAFRSTSELGTTNQFDPVTGVYMPVRAPQKIWGFEGLLLYPITPELNLAASYSWVEGKDTENDTYLGIKQISAPKATAQLNWKPQDNASLSMTVLRIFNRDRFAANEAGEYVGDQGPVDDYTVVNLSGKLDFGNWSTFAAVENLLNRDYYPAKSQGYTYNSYNIKGLGTTVNLGVSYRF